MSTNLTPPAQASRSIQAQDEGAQRQLFLWFRAPSDCDARVRMALMALSEGLKTEFGRTPSIYQRLDEAVNPNVPTPTSTWMEVHPPVRSADAIEYARRVEILAAGCGVGEWILGDRHAEWFACV